MTTTQQAKSITCPACGATSGQKCTYRLPADSPWHKNGQLQTMATGAHKERFDAYADTNTETLF